MILRASALGAVLLWTCLARAAPPAATPPLPTISVAEIHAGQRGYALTVFAGTKPERFDVHVLGVVRRFVPQQDVILVECDDPRLVHVGIVRGMSGSPVYIEGRLAGALAYGFPYAKDPIGGVTPIANMLAELRRPRRGRAETPYIEARRAPRPGDARTQEAAVEALVRGRTVEEVLAERREEHGFLSPLGLPAPLTDQSALSPRLERATLPLSVAGLGASALALLSETLAPFALTPVQAGGVGRGDGSGPTRFEAGGSVAVDLIRGDVSAVGTGTVTAVIGDELVAFGHPLFGIGELYLPISTAEVHTILAALNSSFKLASPLNEAGTLVQDRQSCIVGTMVGRAETIPVSVAIHQQVAEGGASPATRTLFVQVARHRFLTPALVGTVLQEAAQTAAGDVADAVVTVRSKLTLRGFAPVELVDEGFAPDGVSARVMASTSGLRALSELAFNPFGPAQVERVDIDVDVHYRADFADLVAIGFDSDELKAGTRRNLRVTLRPFGGAEYVQTIPVELPGSLAGQWVKITVAAGNTMRPDLAPPESLADVVANLRRNYPSRSLVVSLETADEGVLVRGRVVPDLPGSAIDTLHPMASSRHAETYKRAVRTTATTRQVVVGKQEITIHVKDGAG